MKGKHVFLALVGLLYIVTGLLAPDLFIAASHFCLQVLVRVLPVLGLVFVLMTLTGVFFSARRLLKGIGGREGWKIWFVAIAGGIVSSGPVYIWYPFLAQLREQGLSHGFIACFMYNRAIKVPLIPLMLAYFSPGYIITLTLVMVLMSIAQGLLVNKLLSLGPQPW